MVVTQLPAQRAALEEERRDWWRSAACREMDPELFFPVGARGPGAGDIDRAKAVCAGCRVRRQCLQYALATHQMHGVWGGTTEEERQLRVREQREMEQRQRREMEQRQRRKVVRPARGESGGSGTRARSGRIRSV